MVFLRKLPEKEVLELCNFFYDESQKLSLTINFIDPVKNYDLKEITIAKESEIIVLLKEKQYGKISNEKPHCLLASLNLSNLKQGFFQAFQESVLLKDDLQVKTYKIMKIIF